MSERGGIVVLDFGGQYTQLIARRIREQQVFSAILPCTAAIEQIRKFEPVGIVLSGGPNSVYDPGAPPCDTGVLSMGLPVLGICYGLQWMTHNLGGRVERADRREYGRTELCSEKRLAAFRGPAAKTAHLEQPRRSCARAAGWISRDRRNRQRGFRRRRSGTGNFTPCNFIPKCATPIAARRFCAILFLKFATRSRCGAARHLSRKPWNRSASRWANKRAICALSGGVDSAVAAVLVHRAIGDRLTNIFVDNGVLRKNEFRGNARTCCATAWA